MGSTTIDLFPVNILMRTSAKQKYRQTAYSILLTGQATTCHNKYLHFQWQTEYVNVLEITPIEPALFIMDKACVNFARLEKKAFFLIRAKQKPFNRRYLHPFNINTDNLRSKNLLTGINFRKGPLKSFAGSNLVIKITARQELSDESSKTSG